MLRDDILQGGGRETPHGVGSEMTRVTWMYISRASRAAKPVIKGARKCARPPGGTAGSLQDRGVLRSPRAEGADCVA